MGSSNLSFTRENKKRTLGTMINLCGMHVEHSTAFQIKREEAIFPSKKRRLS